MTTDLHALPYIQAINPYQPGKPITALARELGIAEEEIIKLASNENPLGMGEKARQAIQSAINGVAQYPDQFELIAKLSRHHQVGQNQIVLGNGSNDLLDIIARVFIAPGRSAISSQYAFAIYQLATQSVGGENIVTKAADDYGHDLSAMAAAIRQNTTIIWIANPNNPTGNFLHHTNIKNFISTLPKHIIVVLDEAYNDYLPPERQGDSIAWIKEYNNLIVVRTFSKIHGLAGLRIGYAVASADIADLMNRVRQPFNVNNLALAAASAALDDKNFIQKSYLSNVAGMLQIQKGLESYKLKIIPSSGNFISFCCPLGTAGKINNKLLAEGVIIRPLAAYAMPDWLRVTIGTTEENNRFLEALGKSL